MSSEIFGGCGISAFGSFCCMDRRHDSEMDCSLGM